MCELSQPIWKIKVSVLLGSSGYYRQAGLYYKYILTHPFSFQVPSPSWSILEFFTV
jgi:hypothetical protein